MRVSAGRRDTLVTFLERTGTQSPATGSYTYAWTEIDPPEWCEVLDILPSRSESIEDNISMDRRPCRVRCLYRADITNEMRLTFDGRTLEIVSGPAELGRREGLEMICAELTTQGEAP